jgi:hypothetical protein
MCHIPALALGFHHPGWNGGVSQTLFVKVEYSFLGGDFNHVLFLFDLRREDPQTAEAVHGSHGGVLIEVSVT